jgi:hypothetical protein
MNNFDSKEGLNKLVKEIENTNKIFSTTLVGDGSFPETIKKMHEKTNRYAMWLMIGTFILALVTGFLWWETKNSTIENNLQSSNQKKAEFSYAIWKDFQEFMYNDTFVNKFYYNNDTTKPYQIDSNLQYRKSLCKFLNYFETLYTLYRADKINENIVKDLFENPISKAYNRTAIQNYIKYKRDKMRGFKKDVMKVKETYPINDTEAAKTFDALSLWAGKFKVDMDQDARAINIADEKFYPLDEKKTDSFYKKYALEK